MARKGSPGGPDASRFLAKLPKSARDPIRLLGSDPVDWLLRRLQAGQPTNISLPAGIAGDLNYHTWAPAKRIAANATALQMADQIESAEREALPEERMILAGFSGWGGIDPRQINLDRTPMPPLVASAVREWQAAQDERRVPTTNLFRGLLDQFFTPVPVCRAMWTLAERAAPITFGYGLEPSAGIGRFLQTAPESADAIRWSLVESDPFLARMLSLLYPSAVVYSGRFEPFVTDALQRPGRYDVILENPPYGKWTRSDLDPGMRPYASDIQDYFIKRSLDLLAPGGVLCVVSTAGQLDGTSEANTLLRRFLIADAHLYAACRIGSDIFDRLGAAPANGLAISTWIKLPAGTRQEIGLSPADVAFLRGSYFRDTEEGRASIIGKWGTNRFGEPVVLGEFDEAAVGAIPGIHLSEHAASKIMEARTDLPAPAVKPPKVKAPKPGPTDAPDRKGRRSRPGFGADRPIRDLETDAASLELRIARYRMVLTQQPALAEHGREELRRDVQDFLTVYGAAGQARIPGLDRVVGVLGQGVPRQYVDTPPDTDSVGAIVSWVSSHNGVCLEADVLAYYSGSQTDILQAVLEDPEIAIERLSGGLAYYRMADYLSGNLYTRLDRVNEALTEISEADPLHARLTQQRAKLNTELNPKGITDIYFNPRSGFIPPEAVSAFAKESWIPKPKSGNSPDWEIYAVEGRWKVRRIPPTTSGGYEYRGDVTIRKEADKNAHSKMIFLLGYLNRETLVDDGFHPQRFARYDANDPKEQAEEDATLEQAFTAWVAMSDTYRPQIEDAYNRAFFGERPRDYPSDPVPVLRLSPTRTLHPHQNRATRWFTDRRSGILDWAVGLGKTLAASSIVANLRQIGRVKRGIIIVPNAVLTNWIREIKIALPDYRIGTMGISLDPSTGLYVSDVGDNADRIQKWRAFAAGAYDVMVVSRSSFTRDVTTRTETQFKMLSRIEWLKRGFAVDEEDMALTRRRIDAAKAEIEKKTKDLQNERTLSGDRDKIKAAIKALETKVERWEASLKAPAKGVLAKLQQMIEGAIERGLFQEAGSEPLVEFEDLGIDFMVVDEAHNYKNLYYPAPRYGADAIAYMGGTKDMNEYTGLTIRSWDFYIKALELGERGGGVLLLSATIVKNSPLEVYNLYSYLSPTIWTSREIRTAEEWIDRYLLLEPDEIITADGDLVRTLAVTGFNGDTGPELDMLFSAYSYRITTEQAIDLGLIPRALMPEKNEIPADVDMDEIQGATYAQIKRLVRMENAISEITQETLSGAVSLSKLDQLGKAALAPMILVWDHGTVATRLALHSWLSSKAPEPPERLTLEYPALASLRGPDGRVPQESERIYQAIQEVMAAADCSATTTLFPSALLRSSHFNPKTGRWVRPDAGLLDSVRATNLIRRYFFLDSLDRDAIQAYYQDQYPPKLVALCDAIRGNVGCGHVIFLNASTALFPTVRQALTTLGNVPVNRIAEITGAMTDLSARAAVADAFNGRDADPLTGEPKVDPAYDVILGTDAMAEGVNLQRRTCAIHHLDIPWEPATVKQRNGRGVRQGNTLGSVLVRYYLSRGTIDMKRKDQIVGKTTWQEALLSGAAKGAIELTSDWEEVKILEFAASPAEAQLKLAEMRQRKEIRLRERAVKQATKDIAGMVTDYRTARATPNPADRALRFKLADGRATRAIAFWERNGFDPTPLRLARSVPVLAWPAINLWLGEGEHVALASTDEKDGEWYTDPTHLEIVAIHRDSASVTVRPFGLFRDYLIYTGVKRDRLPPPKLLAPPPEIQVPMLKGTLRRLDAPWDADRDRTLALQKLIQTAVSQGPMVLASHAQISPSFRTPPVYSEVWTGMLREREAVKPYNPVTLDRSTSSQHPNQVPLRLRNGSPTENMPGVLVYAPSDLGASFAPWQNKAAYWDILIQYRPMIPGDKDDEAFFFKEVAEGRAKLLVLQNDRLPRLIGMRPGLGSAAMSEERLRYLMSWWFGRNLPFQVRDAYVRLPAWTPGQ